MTMRKIAKHRNKIWFTLGTIFVLISAVISIWAIINLLAFIVKIALF